MFFSVHKCRQFYFYMDFVSELWHLSDFTPDLNYKKSSVSYYICLVFHSSANIILQENESGRAGLKSDLAVTCSACDESISFQTSANITKNGKSFDVNKRAVYHSLESGTGYKGLASKIRVFIRSRVPGTGTHLL